MTTYPGLGADEEIAKLHELVGQITSNWAEVEDDLFHVFVLGVAGSMFVGADLIPYRAVFFTFSSYEGKMRMTDNAIKARYAEQAEVLAKWAVLRKALNGFAALRNEIAHLSAVVRGTPDPTAKANARLLPPFYKSGYLPADFDNIGYSFDELWAAYAPYCGYHPLAHGLTPPSDETANQLSYRVQRFVGELEPRRPLPPTAPAKT